MPLITGMSEKAKKAHEQSQFIAIIQNMCNLKTWEDCKITLEDLECYIAENLKKGTIEVSFCKEAYETFPRKTEILPTFPFKQGKEAQHHYFVPFAAVIATVSNSMIMAQGIVDSDPELIKKASKPYFEHCLGVLKVLAKFNFNPNVFTPQSHETGIGPSDKDCREWRNFLMLYIYYYIWRRPPRYSGCEFEKDMLQLLIYAGLDCDIERYCCANALIYNNSKSKHRLVVALGDHGEAANDVKEMINQALYTRCIKNTAHVAVFASNMQDYFLQSSIEGATANRFPVDILGIITPYMDSAILSNAQSLSALANTSLAQMEPPAEDGTPVGFTILRAFNAAIKTGKAETTPESATEGAVMTATTSTADPATATTATAFTVATTAAKL